MYHRYFKVTSGPLIEELIKIREQRNESLAQWKAFALEIGAKEWLLYSNGAFGGFYFETPPDMSIWKQNKGDKGLTPRHSVPSGKELWNRIGKLPRMIPFDNALSAIKLDDCPVIFSDRYAHRCTIFGCFNENVFFVKVPWVKLSEADEVRFAEYKDNKASEEPRLWYESEFDHLMWTPHDSLVEVKEWEVLKWKDEQEQQSKAAAS